MRQPSGQLLLSVKSSLSGHVKLISDIGSRIINCLTKSSHPLQPVPVTAGVKFIFLLIRMKIETVRFLFHWRFGAS